MQNIIDQLNECGIAKSNIWDFLSKEGQQKFCETMHYYLDMLFHDNIQKYIKLIQDGNGIPYKKKRFEITQFEYLGRGLSLKEPLINLYLQPEFYELAKLFYNFDDIKLHNIISWMHVAQKNNRKTGSQNWHRDNEDTKILKIFVYCNKVREENGAMEYCKYSAFNPKLTVKQISKENCIFATGDIGDIYFVNNHGFHRGGFLKRGMRLATHGLFLKSDAPLIKSGYFSSFNYNPKLNCIDFESKEFQDLDKNSKRLLQ